MNLSRVRMDALAEVLGITDLEGFSVKNDDVDDGRIVIGRNTIVPNICKDQFVLEADGDLFFTRQCSCVPGGSAPSFFDECRAENDYRKLEPISETTASILLVAFGENLSRSFITRYSNPIYYMEMRLGLRSDLNRLGTGN
jgi:hypothetical protein